MKISYFKTILIFSLYLTLFFNFHLFEYFETNYHLKYQSEFQEYYFLYTGYLLIFTTFASIFFILGQRYLLKPLIIFFILISAVNYYFLNNLGVIIDEGIIQSTIDSFKERNWGEINDVLTFRYFLFLFLFGALPSIALIFIKIEYPSFTKEILTRLIVSLLLFAITIGLIFANYKNISFIARGTKALKERVVPHYFISNIKDYYDILNEANKEVLKLQYSVEQLFPEDNMIGVLVVGETARADRFSLNGYNKQTNPLLEKENIQNFTEAYACGTYTTLSVPCMFSLASYDNFNFHEEEYRENLLDLTKAAGIETIWIENNSSCKHVCDRIKLIDFVEKGSEDYVGYGVHDEITLERLEKLVNHKQSKKLLIVVHTMGSHGPAYYNRYPDKFKKFEPNCETNDPQACNLEALNNTYDNTILYTDYILKSMIDILKKQNSSENFLIYASDHGESLGENGLYLHGAPIRFAPKEQVHVPILMWSSENLKQKRDYPNVKNIDKKITHEFLRHTVMDFFNLKTDYFNPEKSMLR
jgi:lipid A ethanolaminephosphotransferase